MQELSSIGAVRFREPYLTGQEKKGVSSMMTPAHEEARRLLRLASRDLDTVPDLDRDEIGSIAESMLKWAAAQVEAK